MITIQEVHKLQKLAKLEFNDDEIAGFITKLNSVMKMIDELQEVDCSEVEPLQSVSEMNQRLREDVVSEMSISNQLFENIPIQGSNLAKTVQCFAVPKVIE